MNRIDPNGGIRVGPFLSRRRHGFHDDDPGDEAARADQCGFDARTFLAYTAFKMCETDAYNSLGP